MTHTHTLYDPEKHKDPIAFKFLIGRSNLVTSEATKTPSNYEDVLLLKRAVEFGRNNDMDIMYAFDHRSPSVGDLYLGFWNEGVV